MKGYSYLWLLIIIIIGAFFFAGGQFITEDLNKLGVQLSPTPTPPPIGAIGNATATPTPAWGLSAQITCVGSGKQTRAVFAVSAVTYPAFLIIQLRYNGKYETDEVFNTTINSASENDPTKTFNAAYADNAWQAILYEGTSADATKQRAKLEKVPTDCP